MKNIIRIFRDYWPLVLIILFGGFLFFFRYLKNSKRKKLKDELEHLESKSRILSHLKENELRKSRKWEYSNKYLPYVGRLTLMSIVVILNFLAVHFLSVEHQSCVNLLKDINTYNATFLTISFTLLFLFTGKLWKVEEIAIFINRCIKEEIFDYCFKKAERRFDNTNYYKDDIEKNEVRILQIRKELKQIES